MLLIYEIYPIYKKVRDGTANEDDKKTLDVWMKSSSIEPKIMEKLLDKKYKEDK